MQPRRGPPPALGVRQAVTYHSDIITTWPKTIGETVPEIRQPSAPRRGTNLPRMGDFNLTVILDAIRRLIRRPEPR